MGALDSAISAAGGLLAGGMSAMLQKNTSKELWKMQADYNSPANQLRLMTNVGLNPARVLSDKQIDSTMSNAPETPDYAASLNAGITAAQNIMTMRKLQADIDLTKANAENVRQNTAKQSAETEGILTDNEFRSLLNQGRLDELDAIVRERLANASLSDAEVSKVTAEYNLLVKNLDEVDAKISLYKAEADKMSKEAALAELEKELRQRITDSEIKKNDAAIREMAAAAYNMVQQGNSAAVDAANKKIQGIILEATRMPTIEKAHEESLQARQNTRLAKAKARSQELSNERVSAGQKVATTGIIAGTAEVFGVVGRVFSGNLSLK